MKFIKLTNLNDKQPIYINIEQIGHMYRVAETSSYGSVDKPEHTKISTITHNNGGLSVTETVDEIMKMIAMSEFNGSVVIEKQAY